MAYRQQGKDQAAYVVKLLPIAVELIERYKGDDKFKDSPDKVFPVGNLECMEDSLKRIGEKAECSIRLQPPPCTSYLCDPSPEQGHAA